MARSGFRDLTRRQSAVLLAASAANALFFFDQTSTTTALASIQRDLGASAAEAQWVIGIYLLPLAALMVATGRLGDRVGRRRLFVAGVLVFGLGSLLCALAPTTWVLIGARLVQGIGAAFSTPLATAAVVSVFPRERRGFAIGVLATGGTIFLSVGPLLGGILAQEASWRWIFLVNLPVVLLAAAVGARSMDEGDRSGGALDRLGVVLLAAGLSGVSSGLLQAGPWGFTDPRTIVLVAGGVVLLGCFGVVERRREDPLLDLSLLARPMLRGSLAALATIQFAVLVVTVFVPLYVQFALGYSPLEAGLVLLPAVLATPLLSPAMGRRVDRSGPRFLVAGGLGLGALALLGLVLAAGERGVALVLVLLALFGLSRPATFTPASRTAIDAVPDEERGLASGLVTCSRQLGALLGVTLGGAVVAAVEASRRQDLLAHAPRIDPTDTRALDVMLNGQVGHGGLLSVIPPGVNLDVRGLLEDAFVSGFAWAVGLAALLAALVGTLVFFWLRPSEPRLLVPSAEVSGSAAGRR